MWTTLLVAVEEAAWDKELLPFLSQMKKEGLSIIRTESLEWNNYKKSFDPYKSLLLTDQITAAKQAEHLKIAVLALEREGMDSIPHVPYVITSLEGIGRKYLSMVYQRFHGEPIVIAKTERLCIRELTKDEAELFIELCNEAALGTKRINCDPTEYVEAYRRYQYGFYGYGFWALMDKKSGEWIGTAGVEQRENKEGQYLELGYAVTEKKRRQGYAKEACLAILAYLKEELALEGWIRCFVPKGNLASQRTAQSIGLLQAEDIFDKFYCYERIL